MAVFSDVFRLLKLDIFDSFLNRKYCSAQKVIVLRIDFYAAYAVVMLITL
jgi:hypothetical protein